MSVTPTPPGFRGLLQEVAGALDALLNEDGPPGAARIGFVLIAFPMDPADPQTEVAFVTNTKPGDSRPNLPRTLRQAADSIEAQARRGHA